MSPRTCIIVFAICFVALLLRARGAEISCAPTPAGLPQYAQVASTAGTVYRSEYGAMLCSAGCVRLYGSTAPNGSRANVIGVWAGRKDNSITVVRESWTRYKP